MTGEPLERVFVIGPGEVGRRLANALREAGVEVEEVTRAAGWELASSDADALRLVCVREEQLATVLQRLRPVPPDRLVLVQNGWVRPLVERLDTVTRGLIWFTSKGEYFRVLRPSPFAGPRAAPVAAALARGGLPAVAVDAATFSVLEADKMGFNCVVGLPLAAHGLSLGDYLDRHRSEARSLFEESVTVCARALRVEPEPAGWELFLDAVGPLGWVTAAHAKALDFRTRAVIRLAAELGMSAPTSRRLLELYEARG